MTISDYIPHLPILSPLNPPKNMLGQAPHTLGRYGSFSKGPLVHRKAMVQWRTVSSVV